MKVVLEPVAPLREPKRKRALLRLPFRRRFEPNEVYNDLEAQPEEHRYWRSVLSRKRPAMPPPAAAPDPDPPQAEPGAADGSIAHPIELDDDAVSEDARNACTLAVLELFPDICPTFLRKTSEYYAYSYEAIVGYILDKADSGKPYPRKQGSTAAKRKRLSSDSILADGSDAKQPRRDDGPSNRPEQGGANERDDDNDDDDDESEADAERMIDETLARLQTEGLRKCGGAAQHRSDPRQARKLRCKLFQQAFPYVRSKDASTLLDKHLGCLLLALLDFDTQIAEGAPQNLQIRFKRTKTPTLSAFARDRLADGIARADAQTQPVLEEYRAFLAIRELRKTKRATIQQREQVERDNFAQAQLDGTVQECGCCFSHFAMNRMVHCDGGVLHWFCKNCARLFAESQIGLFKHKLECISTDGCAAGFARDQQRLFLDRNARKALDRLELDHCLRMSEIENLETCPFCPFAAECLPPEVDKEFRCQRLECGVVSCRLCRKASHIPKTCAEMQREKELSARLSVEEAMSMALIRQCNKCGTPFIKDRGCNKMLCTRPGCGNVQCYVCHQSCNYTHFNDRNYGGKAGNCPLFEDVETRHDADVRSAEEQAIRAVTEKNPNIDPAALKITLSEAVLEDERRRMQARV